MTALVCKHNMRGCPCDEWLMPTFSTGSWDIFIITSIGKDDPDVLFGNEKTNASVFHRTVRHDLGGQVPYQALPELVGIVLVLIGLSIVGTYLGTGLIWIGAGLAIGGFGGYVKMHHPVLAISGAGGIVIIILGALIERL